MCTTVKQNLRLAFTPCFAVFPGYLAIISENGIRNGRAGKWKKSPMTSFIPLTERMETHRRFDLFQSGISLVFHSIFQTIRLHKEERKKGIDY